MRNLGNKYNAINGYVINHIPPVISTSEFGFVRFGEDPDIRIDVIHYADQIEKLTR